MTFNEKLERAIEKTKSRVCLGLDSDINRLPNHLSQDLDGILTFNQHIIEQTLHHVSAYKLNIAFYECYGSEGWDLLHETMKFIPDHLITIADAKRADIGNTSSYYAKTFFETYNFDSVTVAPYMGFDSIEPFLRYKDKGTIVLVLTSNVGSTDFQEVKSEDGTYFFEIVAKKLNEWNTAENIAAVVGATNHEKIELVRQHLPTSYFLVPGIGAQGGSVKDVIQYAGHNVLINSSRSLIYASSGEDFAEACQKKTVELKTEINSYI